MSEYSPARRAAAWGVHIYTALGLPLALLGGWALHQQDGRLFFLANCLAVFIDGTDGALARKVDVKHVTPDFSGRRLDDIVDFITFSFLPALALVLLDMLPPGWEWFAAVPVLASGYGFCQERAKTEDSFVGFPSYWNIVLVYLFVLQAPPWWVVGIIGTLAVLVFVPVHYVYPSRTALLKPVTMGLGYLWALTIVFICWDVTHPLAQPLAWGSLLYPLYYTVLSGVHHVRVTRTSRV